MPKANASKRLQQLYWAILLIHNTAATKPDQRDFVFSRSWQKNKGICLIVTTLLDGNACNWPLESILRGKFINIYPCSGHRKDRNPQYLLIALCSSGLFWEWRPQQQFHMLSMVATWVPLGNRKKPLVAQWHFCCRNTMWSFWSPLESRKKRRGAYSDQRPS